MAACSVLPDQTARNLVSIACELTPQVRVASGVPQNVIYYGPPGCGKTYRLMDELMPRYSGDGEARYVMVTFHPSMSYEEFVEGLRPVIDERSHQSDLYQLLAYGHTYPCCNVSLVYPLHEGLGEWQTRRYRYAPYELGAIGLAIRTYDLEDAQIAAVELLDALLAQPRAKVATA